MSRYTAICMYRYTTICMYRYTTICMYRRVTITRWQIISPFRTQCGSFRRRMPVPVANPASCRARLARDHPALSARLLAVVALVIPAPGARGKMPVASGLAALRACFHVAFGIVAGKAFCHDYHVLRRGRIRSHGFGIAIWWGTGIAYECRLWTSMPMRQT